MDDSELLALLNDLEEERLLSEKRRAKDLPFDIHPVYASTVDDLYLELFKSTYLPSALAPDIIKENNRSIEQQLMSLRFTTNQTPITPTVLIWRRR
jgi:ATP-dependent DNA helicase RecG